MGAPGTGTKFHPLRRAGRRLAAEIAQRAQSAQHAAGVECSDTDLAKRFALSDHKAVAPWFDAESGKAIAFGDVLALPPELARDMLIRALASLEQGDGPSEEESVGDAVVDVGVLMDAIAHDRRDDGVINNHRRHADNFARAMATCARGYLGATQRAARRRGAR